MPGSGLLYQFCTVCRPVFHIFLCRNVFAHNKRARRRCLFCNAPHPPSPDENNKKRRVFLQRFKCYKNTRHGAADRIRTCGLSGRRTVTHRQIQRYSAGNCVVCTTSGAGFDGYKRMLERKKQYTEPAGKKEWSDGGQAVPSCLNRQIRPVDTPGHLYGLARTRQRPLCPFAGWKGLFCISEGQRLRLR